MLTAHSDEELDSDEDSSSSGDNGDDDDDDDDESDNSPPKKNYFDAISNWTYKIIWTDRNVLLWI